MSTWPAALAKALPLGIVLLIVLNEVPNAGKTLIQPFKISESLGKSELGRSLSERVANTLGLHQQELRTGGMLSPQAYEEFSIEADDDDGFSSEADNKDPEVGPSFASVMTSDSVVSIDAALDQSSTLEIGDNRIPISLILAPIQVPVRALLGVRVISGSVQADQHGYAPLASSTTGETWRVSWPTENLRYPLTIVPQISPAIVASLSDQLVLRIISRDPKVALASTDSAEAFNSLIEGLESWKAYETKREHKDLSEAIRGHPRSPSGSCAPRRRSATRAFRMWCRRRRICQTDSMPTAPGSTYTRS